LRRAGARLKADLLRRGIQPKTHSALGELEVLVDGERVYSYKEEGKLLTHPELLARIDRNFTPLT
jgi:hypothetical protein